jgi:murein DD-endopeptidase MepM/ murein hydrolase activator NlpD
MAITATTVRVDAPEQTGVRPGDVRLRYAPAAAPAAPVAWRPPPYEVPLSVHPDDHYWLIRPLPSGTRNYDLEYYPYGSDVMIPEYAPFRIHHGVDFPNEKGTPVLAAAGGTVIWAGPLPSARNGVNYYGNTVIIEHDWEWSGQKVYTLYAHTLELFVAVGDQVQQGQLIAGVGESGEVSSSHLHFEVRVGKNTYWDTRNPLLWLAPYEGWGTLAGRFTDNLGQMIPAADIVVYSADTGALVRRGRTYSEGVDPDDVWQENFVISDLPAGRYAIHLAAQGREFHRTLEVLPGRTNFTVISADFRYIPPTPMPTMTATPVFTGTLTAPLTPTPIP